MIHISKDDKSTYCGMDVNPKLHYGQECIVDGSHDGYVTTRTAVDGNFSQTLPSIRPDHKQEDCRLQELFFIRDICPECGSALCEERMAKYGK